MNDRQNDHITYASFGEVIKENMQCTAQQPTKPIVLVYSLTPGQTGGL